MSACTISKAGGDSGCRARNREITGSYFSTTTWRVVVAAPAIRSAEMPSPRPTSRNSDPKPHRMSAERHMSSVSHACMAWPPSMSRVVSDSVSTRVISGFSF